jgi:hypothetical protein
MSSQSNDVDILKCEWNWESSILLDITTQYNRPGNPGSRLLADNILDEVRDRVRNLTLDPASGLTILKQKELFPDDMSDKIGNSSVFRKFIRLELYII